MANLELLSFVKQCVSEHKDIFREEGLDWDKGEVTGNWRDPDGSVKILYENSQWFHYWKEDGEIMWD